MKKFLLLILLVIFTMPYEVQAMGERPEVDADCFASDLLRVEVGGEKFAFPRKIIRGVEGSDVVNIKSEKYKGSASGSEACQRTNDKDWVLTSVGLDLYPEPCPVNQSKCSTNLFSTMIEDLDYRKKRNAVEDVFPRTKDELLEVCKAPKKPWNDFHAKTWSSCNFVFEEKKLHVWIKFRGGVYLPEKIESTKQLIIDEIYKYKIK